MNADNIRELTDEQANNIIRMRSAILKVLMVEATNNGWPFPEVALALAYTAGTMVGIDATSKGRGDPTYNVPKAASIKTIALQAMVAAGVEEVLEDVAAGRVPARH